MKCKRYDHDCLSAEGYCDADCDSLDLKIAVEESYRKGKMNGITEFLNICKECTEYPDHTFLDYDDLKKYASDYLEEKNSDERMIEVEVVPDDISTSEAFQRGWEQGRIDGQNEIVEKLMKWLKGDTE